MARRVLGAFAVTATAAMATLAMATPASAHTAEGYAKCDGKDVVLHVDLTQFAPEKRNTVVVKDGDTVLTPAKGKETEKFGATWTKTYKGLDGTVAHKFTVEVKAYDTNKAKGQDFDKFKTYTVDQPCVQKPPTKTEETTTTTTPPVTTSPEVPSSSEVPPSTTPAAPGGSAPEPPLAATGASPVWLLLSGLGLVGAGAGTLLFLRRRRSA
ncbi:LPXTG cell wall anchor domain-containing protein [Lentzea californiensis]|uniref:LPXTG cell wall anchor domain-containing protein n=1 Tax=Lentzea californiensis TaxID=438851 RepID=UPI0021655310|nr:LPXTG cell wall anchor domain-containing protein [Lentzea californiensis]MCR3751231.1 LPXTG-motif cell wall anchor domain-containing protein [Lentzea californiensis]